MSILDKRINKRQAFVTMGCSLFPYERIKELAGDTDGLNFLDIIRVPIQDDEKVITIQSLDFFSDPFNRILALRYARLTFEAVGDQLAKEERELAAEALTLLDGYVLGNKSRDEVDVMNKRIRAYLEENLKGKDYTSHKTRIACLENILSVSKEKAANAVAESSSIQRDVLGEKFAATQLMEIEKLAFRLHATS